MRDSTRKLSSLKLGDRVRKFKHVIGTAKLENPWSTEIYEIVGIPDKDGGPFVIKKLDPEEPEFRVTGTMIKKIEQQIIQ